MKRLLCGPRRSDRSQSAHAIRGIYQKEGLFRAVLDRYIDRFAAKQKHSCFVKRKAWSLRWLTILRHRQLLYQQRHPGWLLYDQQCTTLSPDSGDIANTLKSRHACKSALCSSFYVNDKRAGKSHPL